MTTKLEVLELALKNALGERAAISSALGEVTVVVKAADYLAAMQTLRDDKSLAFEEMIDLCGVDYLNYGEGTWDGLRFAVVVHLLSIEHNWRVRVRVFCPDDEMPYDPEQKRVIYQPVTIEPRENIPRVIREETYGMK